MFSFVAGVEDSSIVLTSLDIPHDGDRDVYVCNEEDAMPPKWEEGQIAECYEPMFIDDLCSQYSCGNEQCIRFYYDLSEINKANILWIMGLCMSCMGGISCVFCCFSLLRQRCERRRLATIMEGEG